METEESLLTEILIDNDLIDATPGQRFVNMLLDLIGFYIFSFVVGIIVGIGIRFMAIYNHEVMSSGSLQIFFFVMGLISYLLYYTLLEKIANGKTLGKLVTKTRAVRYDGTKLTFKNAFLRSLVRFVPLDGLVLLFSGAPWHDEWTNTRVVKD